MGFFSLSKMDFKKRTKGISGKVVTGENLQMAYIRLEHGVETSHCHENEQMGYIISGEIEITIDSEKKICRTGDAYLIPPNVQHGFKVLSECPVEYIELFSPPKEELKKWYSSS